MTCGARRLMTTAGWSGGQGRDENQFLYCSFQLLPRCKALARKGKV